MKLVIGGYAQGKLKYAVEQYKLENYSIWDGEIPQIAWGQRGTLVLNHFQEWVKNGILNGRCPEEEIRDFLEKYPDCVIVSDEVGNGIVPVEAFEREYRERTGRILVELAQKAEEVVRVICGIGQRIK